MAYLWRLWKKVIRLQTHPLDAITRRAERRNEMIWAGFAIFIGLFQLGSDIVKAARIMKGTRE